MHTSMSICINDTCDFEASIFHALVIYDMIRIPICIETCLTLDLNKINKYTGR